MGATNYYLSGASAVFGQLKPPSSGTPAVEWFSNMVQASWFQAIAPPIAFVLIGMYAKRLGRREGDDSPLRNDWAVSTTVLLMTFAKVITDLLSYSTASQVEGIVVLYGVAWIVGLFFAVVASINIDRFH